MTETAHLPITSAGNMMSPSAATDLRCNSHLSLKAETTIDSAASDLKMRRARQFAHTHREMADVKIPPGQKTSKEHTEVQHANVFPEENVLPISPDNSSWSKSVVGSPERKSKSEPLPKPSCGGPACEPHSEHINNGSSPSIPPEYPQSNPKPLNGPVSEHIPHGNLCSGSTLSENARSSTFPLSGNLHSGSTSERIGTALDTLKSELTALRQQDLQLLKQLIHINDNIRRLKRSRWLQRGGRTISCGALGSRIPSSTPAQSSIPAVSGVGKDRASLLLRQRSEPGLLGLPFRRVSTLTSTSSFETINDDEDEEEDSLYGSVTDLQSISTSSPLSSPRSPSHHDPSLPNHACSSPSAYTSLTFTQEELWRGESSFGEILKRNVRLWKWSVAREKENGVVEGHPCVL